MMEPSEDSNAPMNIGLIPRWHHVDCFVKERANLEVDASVTADRFTGFSQLEKKDQDVLKKKLGANKVTKGKKRKVEEEEKPPKKQKTDEEEAEEKALKVIKLNIAKYIPRYFSFCGIVRTQPYPLDLQG